MHSKIVAYNASCRTEDSHNISWTQSYCVRKYTYSIETQTLCFMQKLPITLKG